MVRDVDLLVCCNEFDYSRFAGLRWHNPLAAAAGARAIGRTKPRGRP